MVNIMIKIKYSVFCFCILLFTNCTAYSQIKQDSENNIDKYLDMRIVLSQDTVLYGDEIVLTIFFTNKSDSCISFYPRAILLVDIYYPGIRPFINPPIKGHFLTEPPFFENLTILPPQGIHEEKFILKINESLFFKKLIVFYICERGNSKHKKSKIDEKSNVLFGRLYSDPFEIHIRNK